MELIKQEILNSGKSQESIKKEKRNLMQSQKLLKGEIIAQNDTFQCALNQCQQDISTMMKNYQKKSSETV